MRLIFLPLELYLEESVNDHYCSLTFSEQIVFYLMLIEQIGAEIFQFPQTPFSAKKGNAYGHHAKTKNTTIKIGVILNYQHVRVITQKK